MWRSQLLVIVSSIILIVLLQTTTKAQQEILPGGAELEIGTVARLPQALKAESNTQNGKVVMFDASHNQDPYNDCSYWIQDLEAVGYTILVNTEPLNFQTISNVDVLIILVLRYNGPISSPYTAPEAQIIRQFVFNGGGLMLLADHDGYGWYAQEIALTFGVSINGNSIIKQPVFSNTNFDVAHPIMAGINSVGYNWYATIYPGASSPLIWDDDGNCVAITFSEFLGRGAIFGDCNWPLTTFNNYHWVDHYLRYRQSIGLPSVNPKELYHFKQCNLPKKFSGLHIILNLEILQQKE